MNRGILATSAGIILGLFLSGCTNPSLAQRPPLTVPDVGLLLKIANEAIRVRLPSVRLEDLELRHLDYVHRLNDLDNAASEQFDVEFRVKGSKRQVEEGGATIFTVDSVDVTIELDGRIGKGGVSKGIEKFHSANPTMLSNVTYEDNPISGDPFYPVKLNTPLPKPDRASLKEIAVNAISRFLPAVDIKDLDLREASFHYVSRPEDGIKSEGFWVTFWIKRSVRVTETEKETKINGDEITVLISPTGEVERGGVDTTPFGGTYFKHNP